MEVYIPWNDTWINLPPLPNLGDGGGRLDTTPIMFLPDHGGGGSFLYLLGGSSTDWNTEVATATKTVWRLMWDSSSQTYSWTNSIDPELGRYSHMSLLCLLHLFLTDLIFNDALAAEVPDNFLGPYRCHKKTPSDFSKVTE